MQSTRMNKNTREKTTLQETPPIFQKENPKYKKLPLQTNHQHTKKTNYRHLSYITPMHSTIIYPRPRSLFPPGRLTGSETLEEVEKSPTQDDDVVDV